MREVTRRLARRARGIRYDALDGDTLAAARHCLLDYLGCALAGAGAQPR